MPWFVIVFILLSTLISAIGQFLFRKALLIIGPATAVAGGPLAIAFRLVINPFFILGLSCYAISLCAWMIVLSRLQVSVAYPFSSLGFVFAALIGCFFLGEQLSSLRVLGIALTCLGLVVLARSS